MASGFLRIGQVLVPDDFPHVIPHTYLKPSLFRLIGEWPT
jgi:hypothetical protein